MHLSATLYKICMINTYKYTFLFNFHFKHCIIDLFTGIVFRDNTSNRRGKEFEETARDRTTCSSQ